MNTASSKKKHSNKLKQSKHKLKTKSSKADAVDTQREAFIKAKIRKLNNALDSDPVNVDLLRKLMISNEGCVTNDIRCKVWPKLLNINIFTVPRKKKADVELKEFQENRWWHQVNLDVKRSHRRFPFETRLSRKRVLQHQLTSIIMRVLCRNPELSYYQGYHDIAVTLLRVLGEDLATAVLDQLSKTHIRDFMDKNMNRTNKMLSFFYAVIGKADVELEQFLLRSDVGTIFALSWLITWYGHDLNGFDLIVRLCDLFLATHPVMPVYVAVALVLTHKNQVLERECDMAMVHHCLCRLPTYIGVDEIESLISKSYELYQAYPPETLKAEVRKYIRESDSISQHAELIYQSYNQRPDSILRRRKKHGRLFSESSRQVSISGSDIVASGGESGVLIKHEVNPMVKVAVWAMTVSMGVMTYFVLNTHRYLNF